MRNYEWLKEASAKRKKLAESNFVKLLTEENYISLGEYEGNKHKVSIQHKICGHIFKMRPNDF